MTHNFSKSTPNKVTNLSTEEVLYLTDKELERFFDNRNPMGWKVMTSKFKVGDKIRVVKNICGGCFGVGFVGYITKVHDMNYQINETKDYEYMANYYDPEELELVQEETQMSGPNEIILYVVYNTQEVDVPEVYTDGLTALTRLGQDPDLAVSIEKVF